MEEIKILSIGIADAFLGVFMGMLAGAALTLMDRIDEHHIIQRHRTFLAYLAAFFSAVSTILAIEWFPVIYPFAFGLSLLWIFKNKIDFPSHVFSLFLMAIYFGLRIDLFWLYAPYIVLLIALQFISGTLLRAVLIARPGWFWRWYYASYTEKFFIDLLVAVALKSFFPILYLAGFVVASYKIKHWLPGYKNNQQSSDCNETF